MEADIPPEDAIEALNVLAEHFKTCRKSSQRTSLTRRYRAILVAGMCAVASKHYEDGTYWPFLPAGFGTSIDPNHQGELANAFRESLRAMGLARFTTPLRNVGEILMHSGVPVQSISKLVQTLAKWDSHHSSGDGQSFVAWATSMSQTVATTRGFDVPTWRFLTEGGEIAEDFIDRCLTAIDGGTEDTGLPALILEAVQAALAWEPRRARGSGRRTEIDNAPSVTYSPHGGVQVRLPPLEREVQAALSWTVTAGGSRDRVDVPAPWPDDPVAPKWVPVRAPQQRVLVSVLPGPREWTLEMFDPTEPLLVFDGATGALIPPRNSMPKGRVWVVVPNPEAKDVSDVVEVGDVLSVIAHENTPRGWEGWSFVSVDTSVLGKLRVRGFGDRWRYASTVDKPRLSITERIEFAESLSGQPVLGTRPKLVLPGPVSDGAATLTWLVSVSNPGGAAIVTDSFVVSSGTEEVDPWRSFAGPIVGEFTITVRGPLGRGATLRTAVAESVSVASSTPFRWMSEDGTGLESATAIVKSSAIELGTDPLRLGSTDTRVATTLRVGQAELPLMVTVPYLSVELIGVQEHQPSIVPVSVDNEALVGSILKLTAPKEAGRVTLAAVVSGTVVQTVDAAGAPQSRSRMVNLAALADTIARHRTAVLRVVAGDRSVAVAHARPRRLASDAFVTEDGVLELADAAPTEGLVAYLYPEFAPWRLPQTVYLPTGATSVQLSDDMRQEGRATVVISVDNPWVPATPPPRPDRHGGNAFSVKVGRLTEVLDTEERGFRRWLAGMGDCPVHPDGLPIALKIYSLIPSYAPFEHVDRMRSELAAAVRANRTRLMDAVLATDVNLSEIMRLLIEADVVTVPRELWESSPALWTFSAALGVIADTDELGGAGQDDFCENVLRYLGEPGAQILRSGCDPEAKRGRFGESYVWLLRRPDQQVEDLWRAVSIVPLALLDESSRTEAAYQLFRARGVKRLRRTVGHSEEILSVAETALQLDLGAPAIEPITSRRFQPGWGNLPAVSLALALIARGAARGKAACAAVFDVVRDEYARLAAAAPAIVEQDLGLAELWITRWEDIE